MEFWVGAGVAAGLIKVKALKRIGEKLKKLTGKNSKKKKGKKKKK